MDATRDQIMFMDNEVQRMVDIGAWEEGRRSTWISPMFLVPKPGSNKWRVIIDLRFLNRYCRDFSIKYETLKKLKNLAQKNDYCFSLDLADGYYCLGIREVDRDFFTVNYRGRLLRLACLPMGWNASPYVFCMLMQPLVRYLRSPLLATGLPTVPCKKRLRTQKWKGIRLLPFLDDYLFLASTYAEAISIRSHVQATLERLGLSRNEKKGYWEPVQVLEHLGLEIDTRKGEFRAPPTKLAGISQLARAILGRAARDRRWVPVKLLSSLAGKAQFLYLAIPAARFYLRELHTVSSSKESWSARVKVTNQLWRDLQWWAEVPVRSNGRTMFRHVETAYLHVDSSDYGWGAVLNDMKTARGFWYDTDRASHITFKELKAVRLAIESFLPYVAGRAVLLHEDNQAVVAVLTHFTTRSPQMMVELRKLWYLLDTNDINIRPRYIRSAANIWADALSRELDTSDWKLNPKLFKYVDKLWGPHTIDRFASKENRMVDRYNSRWLDPLTEGVDALRFSDASWRRENNWCNPPWELLEEVVLKLRNSRAAATVVVPAWRSTAWFQQLQQMAAEVLLYPPAHDLFFPGRLGGREGVGTTHWSVAVFRVPYRHGCT